MVSTLNKKEVAQFDAIADKWWDENGPMKPLHRLNPVRLAYVRRMMEQHFNLDPASRTPLRNLSVLDVGCGGGLIAEPMARMGANVTGIDAGPENIKAAAAHARAQNLDIRYLAQTAEAHKGAYDAVLALEIIEHVDNPEHFVAALVKLVRPGGLIIASTLNRTPRSYMLGILAAEYILGWLPRGTHDWKKFIKPSEFAAWLRPHGAAVTDITGLAFNPASGTFVEKKGDAQVNYMICATRNL